MEEPKVFVRLALAGDSNVGKTSILRKVGDFALCDKPLNRSPIISFDIGESNQRDHHEEDHVFRLEACRIGVIISNAQNVSGLSYNVFS